MRFIQLVKITPGQNQAHHLGFAAAGCHFHHITPPALIEHLRRHHAAAIEAHQIELVFRADYLIKINNGFQRLALCEEILELKELGYKGFLIGETLMRSGNAEEELKNLIN